MELLLHGLKIRMTLFFKIRNLYELSFGTTFIQELRMITSQVRPSAGKLVYEFGDERPRHS